MADENKFLHLGNSNDKILYDKFKGKLEKKDIATNNKLLQIFNFFDKDGNGIIETANSKGVNEMQSLWNAVRTSATKNSNSIFEDSEAQEFLANSVDSTGKSLADNQVTASDLFAFLKALITPQSKQANGVKLEDLKPEDIVEYTPEEIEDISIQTVTVGVRQAREVFDAQKAQQGKISDFVNETKETFDTEYASSRVDRYLMNEELCAQLLQRAKEDGLSEKEYLEAKIDLAMKLIQSLEKYSLRTEVTQDAINISLSFLTLGIADKKETKNSRELKAQKLELENLKTLLAKLSPEEINMLISQLLFIEDNPKGNSNFDFSFGGKNNKAKPQTVTRYGVEGEYLHISPEEYEGEAAPNSLESLSKPYAIYKKMTFEEVFEKERGVQYNPEAIMDYSTKEAHLQFLVGMHNRNEAIKNILHDATVAVDGNNKYGAPQHDAIETCNQNLANQIETAFRSLYSKNAAEAQRVIDEIMGQNSGIKVVADEQGNFIKLEFYGFKRNSLNLDLLGGTKLEGTTQESEVGFENNKFRMPVNAYSLVHLSKGLQQKLEDNYQTALKGKTLDEYSAEVKSAYQMAYGAENAEDMASAFVQSQQEGVQNTKAVVQGLGMVAMVAGQLIPVGGQAATALIVAKGAITYGGMLTSTLGSVGVSAVENYTKAGGPTEEDKKAMLQELGTSLALVGSGMGIGKGSEAIFRTLVMKNCPKLIAFAAEVGVDATASLLADYAITGQIDLSGEGIAQLQNILVGIIGAKGARNYLNTHAGDIKDVSGAGRPRNFGISDGVKPMTEMDYGRRLLGNVVTVVDPKTGAAMEGEVTGLHNTNGQVEIEVNGQRFSTNDVTGVKREVKAPKSDVENFSKEDVTKLLKDKGFPDDLISDILSKTTKENIEIVREMVSDKDFPREQLVYILSCTTKDNIEIAREMILDKDFPRDEIMYILSNTRKDNIEIAEDLLSDKDFPKKDICGILSKTTKDNIEVAKELISDKDFPRKDICGILSKTTKDNIEIAHALISDTSFPRDLISDVLSKTTKDNIEVARELILNKDFPRDEIMYILNNTTKDNIEIARDLISDKDFPRKDICGILSKTTKDNIEIALALISDTSFPRDLISDVLSKITKENIEIVESGTTNRNYLKTKDGTEITLDNFNRLVVLKFKGTTKKVSYSSEDSKTPNLIEIYDVKNKLNSEIHINDDCEIELDYVHGKAITKDKKSGIVTERELQQSEYPVNISFKSRFWYNLSNELEDCKSIDEIKTISDNYSSKGYNIPNYILEYSINKNITEGFSQCKTLEELNRCRDAYISKGITVPDKIYNKQYNTIIYNEIKNCQTIDDLNTFKDAYSKKGISIPEDIYNSRQNEIFSRQLDSCKTIEDLYAFKNAYLKKGITISDNIFNKKLYSIILTEIKNCKSLEDLNSLKKYYKKQPFSIPNKVFDYYSAQLTNPPLSNLEKRIKSGNEFSNDRFQKEQFNLSDSKYENNLEAVYSDMQRRIERDMGALSDTQISDIAQNISLKMQIPVEEVLEVMSRLTQFGSMKTLEKLGSELDKYNISGFYTEGGISSNSTLNYLLTKEQITLNNGSEKKAFILDDAGLKYLESLKPTDIKEFYQKVKEQKIVLIELDGTGLKIGNNYYSYTMLDGGQNLGAMTEAVLVQTQSGKSIDEVLQSDFRQRLNKIFEDTDTGENFADSFVKTVSNKYIATPQNIAAQIRPNMPDADYIKKVIETVVENTKGLTDTEKVMARSVIAKYYDYMVKIYSQDSIAELLKTRHNAIEEHVLRIGKTMDDVVYIYPVTGKSFDLVCLQYAKINGIEPGKIIQYDGTKNNKSLNGKVVVLLDDVVGSGDSMTSQQFKYEQFLYNQKNVNMLFVPITCADNGKHNIINTICMNSRSEKDFLIHDATQSSRYEDFVNLLTLEEKRVLDKVIGSKGYHESGLVTGFQYMTPDNNSCLSGYLNLINLNNPTADKTLSYNDEIGNMLLQYINERRKHPPI